MRVRVSVIVAMLVLLVTSGASANETTTRDDWVRWAAERSLILDPTGWPAVTPDELGPVIDQLDEKRFVFLGEPDHYIAEKYDYRLALIRALVGEGYRHIGMEMGFSDGVRIDRYLETGDERHLDRVATYGYRGDLRPDRRPVPKTVRAVAEQPFYDAFVAAERDFLGQLREISASLEPDEERLHWFGWDIDAVYPDGGYADAREILDPHTGVPVVEDIVMGMALVPSETSTEEVARLERVLALIVDRDTETRNALGRDDAEMLRRIVQNLIDSLSFYGLAFREPFGQHWNEALQQREAALIDRLDTGWMAELDPSTKVILMGHNMHLGKDSSTLASGRAGSGETTGMWPTLGSAIADRSSVYSVWMLYDHGTSVRALATEATFVVPSHPDRIEHLLAGIGEVLILPLLDADPRAAWLDQDRNFIQNGDYASGQIRRQADAIFFVEEVNAVGQSGG